MEEPLRWKDVSPTERYCEWGGLCTQTEGVIVCSKDKQRKGRRTGHDLGSGRVGSTSCNQLIYSSNRENRNRVDV